MCQGPGDAGALQHRGEDRSLGEAMEPAVGVDDDEAARPVKAIGQPDLASGRSRPGVGPGVDDGFGSLAFGTLRPRFGHFRSLGGGPELIGLVHIERGDDHIFE